MLSAGVFFAKDTDAILDLRRSIHGHRFACANLVGRSAEEISTNVMSTHQLHQSRLATPRTGLHSASIRCVFL